MNYRQFATLTAITFVVGMIWLAADIIFNTKASIPVSPKLQTLLEPVSPNFNPRVVEIIEKEVLEKANEVSAPISLPSTSPATESAQITL